MSGRAPPPLTGPAWLALSGLVPFFGLAVAVGYASDAQANTLLAALIAYAGVVQGFTGGVRWGAELVRAPDAPDLARLAAAGLITVPAWGAVLLVLPGLWAPFAAVGLLAITGLVQLAWDLAGARAGLLPAWTARLRITLTVLALAALFLASLRLM